MEAIKVTDSFNQIINRFEKENAENKARFERENAENKARFERESAVSRVIMGLTLTSIIALTIAVFTTSM
jgi:hypothetical protein